MNVLSLFDGIAGARVALDRLGIQCTYYASEIDKYAISIAQRNYPDICQLGDVRLINPFLLPEIDLLIGGSPCQDLSLASHSKTGLDGERSGLFFEYIRLLNYLKPKYFLLENVASMSKTDCWIISRFLGVEPIRINSSSLSAQQRERYYWTNFPVSQPEDKHIYLNDIIEYGVVDRDKAYCIDSHYYKGTNEAQYKKKKRRQIVYDAPVQIGYIQKNQQGRRVYDLNGKSVSLKSEGGGWGAKMGLYEDGNVIRMLTPIECERLQTFKDSYTEFGADGKRISNTQRYKCLGNSFTVDVIAHILSGLTSV
jgi:DNA (cytosine-5)-methyltransferase 3A